jgi:two-component system sensor histidine kinase TctE
MFWKKIRELSIRKQLLLSLIGPLLLLSIVSAGLTYWLALQLSNEIYDELLVNTADSVVARIDYVKEKRTFDFPESAEAVFRHQDKDQFYYKVSTQEGAFIYGDAFVPDLAATATAPQFADGKINGESVRMVSVFNQVPNKIEKQLVVTTAETCNARISMAQKILVAIVVLQILVIAGGTASLWTGINAGLAPLNNIRVAMSRRSPTDLTPVTIEHAPVEVLPMLEAINSLLAELRIYIASQSRFVSDAAHQLRTPLAGVKTFVDLGAMHADDDRSIKVYEQLKLGVARMTQMVNRLLSLARAEASPDRFAADQQVDMNALTEDVVKSVWEAWKHKSSTEVSFHPSEESAVIIGSEDSLRELVENLVHNAIVYTPEGGEVSISVRTNDGVELSVEDNGPGIPPDERDRVFERFYRIGGGSNQTGSGLGLSIVKEIVDKHAATITIAEAAAGKGCNFLVKFSSAAK